MQGNQINSFVGWSMVVILGTKYFEGVKVQMVSEVKQSVKRAIISMEKLLNILHAQESFCLFFFEKISSMKVWRKL